MKHLRIRSHWSDLARHSARQVGSLFRALPVPAALHACMALAAVAVVSTSARAQVAPIAAPAKTLTRTTSFEYDPATGLGIKEIKEPGIAQLRVDTDIAYDGWGNKKTATLSSPATGLAAASTRTQTTHYDVRGQFATSTVNALLQNETVVYDPLTGLLKSSTGPNGLTTEFQYDELGRKILEIYADGNRVKVDYLYCGGTITCPSLAKYVVVMTPLNAAGAANGAWRKRYFDVVENEVASETLGFDGVSIAKTSTIYDSADRVYRKSRPYFQSQTPVWDTYAYDSLDRVTSVTGPDNSVSKVSFNGLETVVRNALDQKRTTVKDVLGRISTITDANNGVLRYEYDTFNNVYRTTDASNNTITMAYDIRGNKIQLIDPDMGSRTYVYNAFSEVVRETDAKNQVVATTYDKLGRPTSRAEADLNATWTYDSCGKGVGKICSAQADNGFARNFSYDAYGRPSGISATIDAVYNESVSYDANGRVATQTYPNGFATKFVYTSLGLLKEIRNNATDALYWRADSKNAAGDLLQQTFGNNVVTQQIFDPLTGRIQNIYAGAGNGIQNLTYKFDASGNLEKRSDPNQSLTENFLYDPLRRLTSSTVNSGGAGIVTQTYGYNAIGNTLSRSDVGTYAYCGVNKKPHAVRRVTFTDGRNRVYQYDANGNLTSEAEYDSANNLVASKARNTSYTSFNMPKTITSATAAATFTYDTEHQRIKQVSSAGTTVYVHPDAGNGLTYEKLIKPDSTVEHRYFIEAGNQLVAVVTQSGSTLTTAYMHQDYLGSVTAVTNQAGSVIESFAYEPFGKRRTTNGSLDPNGVLKGNSTNRGFTEHEHLDSLGLIHMNGRIYDPLVGRFMSADPTVPYAGDGQSYNRFSYARNNPLAYVDPTGFSDESATQTVVITGQMRDRDYEIISVFGMDRGRGSETIQYYQLPQVVGRSYAGTPVVIVSAKRLYKTLNMEIFRAQNARNFMALVGGTEVLDMAMRDARVPRPVRAVVRVALTARNPVARMVMIAQNNGVKASHPLPDKLVGDQESDKAGQRGKRHTSGTLLPENGGTGDAQADFDYLTGGTGQPAGGTYNPDALKGDNGIVIRPGKSGTSIDIPANGGKPPETLHYP